MTATQTHSSNFRPALYLAVVGPQEAESAVVVKTTSGGSAGCMHAGLRGIREPNWFRSTT